MRAIAWICAAFTAASILYWLLTARWLGQRMRAGASEADGVDAPPNTFFRPLKPRVPSLPEKLRAFVAGLRNRSRFVPERQDGVRPFATSPFPASSSCAIFASA